MGATLHRDSSPKATAGWNGIPPDERRTPGCRSCERTIGASRARSEFGMSNSRALSREATLACSKHRRCYFPFSQQIVFHKLFFDGLLCRKRGIEDEPALRAAPPSRRD